MTAFHLTTNGVVPIRQPAPKTVRSCSSSGNRAVGVLRQAQDVRVLSRAFVEGVPDRTGCAGVTAGSRAGPSRRCVTAHRAVELSSRDLSDPDPPVRGGGVS